MTDYKTIAISVLAGILLAGCSAASKLRRAERLIAKAEQQGAIWKTDTVYDYRQISVPEIHVDTLVKWQEAIRDTIVVTRDRITTKVKITPGMPVYVRTEEKADTIRIEVPVTVTKTISAGYSKWHVVWTTGLGFLIGLIIGMALGRFVKFLP